MIGSCYHQYSDSQQFTRSFHYRPVCQQDQCSVTTTLQLEARPSSQSSGCLFIPLGIGQTIPVSTFQSHRESLNQDSNRSNRVCLSHSPSLATQVWYPQLLKSLVRAPILLPVRLDLLQSPDQIPHPLLVEERMFLAAWPICSRDSLCRAFQQELPTSSSNPGGSIHTQHITQPERSGVAGVLQNKLIHFQPL